MPEMCVDTGLRRKGNERKKKSLAKKEMGGNEKRSGKSEPFALSESRRQVKEGKKKKKTWAPTRCRRYGDKKKKSSNKKKRTEKEGHAIKTGKTV